jgi:hypothetical protein
MDGAQVELNQGTCYYSVLPREGCDHPLIHPAPSDRKQSLNLDGFVTCGTPHERIIQPAAGRRITPAQRRST